MIKRTAIAAIEMVPGSGIGLAGMPSAALTALAKLDDEN